MLKFSVLISFYEKENPVYLDRALKSVWDDQSIKPNEIVLVQDGPVNMALEYVVMKWKEKLGNILNFIKVNANLGLGYALKIGLMNCSYDIVARMDADDISAPNRFEKQLYLFSKKNIDICGSWAAEFYDDELKIAKIKTTPITNSAIKNHIKYRNPLNHPSVMFKRKSVEISGGYIPMKWFEDYYLWVRMSLSQMKFYNIPEPLLKMRLGSGQLSRRRGINYALAEFNFFSEIYRIGFINISEFLMVIFLRIPLRILPESILKKIYSLLRASEKK